MDLKSLIPSKTRRLVIEYFITNPEDQIHVNELARKLKTAPQLVYRELINMENWGLLLSSKRGNQRVYRVKKRFVFLAGLTDIMKSYQIEQNRIDKIVATYDLKKMIKEQKKISVPIELVSGLLSKRKRPRAYDEEVILARREHGKRVTK